MLDHPQRPTHADQPRRREVTVKHDFGIMRGLRHILYWLIAFLLAFYLLNEYIALR